MSNEYNINPDNYANWFALYCLCSQLGNKRSIRINSREFGDLLGVSQQTASRRINELMELNWINRKIKGKTQIIWITEKGADVMLGVYKTLKKILERVLIVGEVTEGMGEGAYYVAIKGYYEQFREKLGYKPFKGTLNLKLSDMNNSLLRENLNNRSPVIIDGFEDQSRKYGPVECYDCKIAPLGDRTNVLNAAILDIERTHHKSNIVEIMAEPYLRDYYNLKDGDRLIITLAQREPS
ncbi:MAG: DUF120 domain-containing protein [Promethearchaeia archaeon]